MTSFGSVPGFPLDLKKLHPPRTQLAPIWSLSELKTITKTVLIFCARAHKILEGLTGGNGVPVLIPWALKDAPWGASWPQFGGFRTSKRSQKRFSYFVRARTQSNPRERHKQNTPSGICLFFFGWARIQEHPPRTPNAYASPTPPKDPPNKNQTNPRSRHSTKIPHLGFVCFSPNMF